jgi:hypothetical protein
MVLAGFPGRNIFSRLVRMRDGNGWKALAGAAWSMNMAETLDEKHDMVTQNDKETANIINLEFIAQAYLLRLR